MCKGRWGKFRGRWDVGGKIWKLGWSAMRQDVVWMSRKMGEKYVSIVKPWGKEAAKNISRFSYFVVETGNLSWWLTQDSLE